MLLARWRQSWGWHCCCGYCAQSPAGQAAAHCHLKHCSIARHLVLLQLVLQLFLAQSQQLTLQPLQQAQQ
jgi:hypothetical protein